MSFSSRPIKPIKSVGMRSQQMLIPEYFSSRPVIGLILHGLHEQDFVIPIQGSAESVGSMIWYDCFCGHPDKERERAIDPVTGEEEFVAYNSLGLRYFTDESRPHARDVNVDGRCDLFEAE